MITNYPDIPRIYTAISEWMACLVYISVLKKKVNQRELRLIMLIALVIQSVFLVATGDLPVIFWVPSMTLATIFMFLFIYASCQVTAVTAAYYSARAFLLAEFVASLQWQLHSYFAFNRGLDMLWLKVILFVVIYGGAFILAWYVEKKWMYSEYAAEITRRELFSAVIIVVITFALSNLSFVYQNSPFSAMYAPDIFTIRTVVDLGGIAILYAYQSRINELNMEKEISVRNAALKKQYDQYRFYQDSVETIQIKYHDLKHQIIGLRAENDPDKRREWLNTLESELDPYETSHKTGNQVLDTLLASKILSCKKHQIKLTYVIDGKLLDFIHVTDICTIFGNALDNAIESVVTLEDPEQRLIHVSVSNQKNFLFIKVENYCDEEVEIKDDLPVTTKADKKNHGFGLKSIRYATQKYDGNISISVNKKWFILKILIPMPS